MTLQMTFWVVMEGGSNCCEQPLKAQEGDIQERQDQAQLLPWGEKKKHSNCGGFTLKMRTKSSNKDFAGVEDTDRCYRDFVTSNTKGQSQAVATWFNIKVLSSSSISYFFMPSLLKCLYRFFTQIGKWNESIFSNQGNLPWNVPAKLPSKY